MTKTGRAELYDLPVIGGSVASHRDVGIKEKKDNLSGCPSSLSMVAGVGFEPTTSGL